MEFTVGSCIRFGWETFKKRPWFFVGSTLAIVVISWAIGAASGAATALFASSTASEGVGGFAGFIVSFGLQTLFAMGITAFYLKAHESPERTELADLWHPQHFIAYLMATILTSVVVLLGFLLLIIPGIVLALMLMFVAYIVVARDLDPIAAMKESARITKGYKWQLLALALALAGLNILGTLLLVVGLLVSIPVTYLALVHAYRVLEQKASAVAAA